MTILKVSASLSSRPSGQLLLRTGPVIDGASIDSTVPYQAQLAGLFARHDRSSGTVSLRTTVIEKGPGFVRVQSAQLALHSTPVAALATAPAISDIRDKAIKAFRDENPALAMEAITPLTKDPARETDIDLPVDFADSLQARGPKLVKQAALLLETAERQAGALKEQMLAALRQRQSPAQIQAALQKTAALPAAELASRTTARLPLACPFNPLGPAPLLS